MNESSLKTMLHDYVQGKLSAEEVKIVQKILKQNPNLNNELFKIKEYYSNLSLLEPQLAPDDFLEKVHSKINAPLPFYKKLISPKWLSAEAAGLIVSIALVILVVNPFNFKDSPTIEYDDIPKPVPSQSEIQIDEPKFQDKDKPKKTIAKKKKFKVIKKQISKPSFERKTTKQTKAISSSALKGKDSPETKDYTTHEKVLEETKEIEEQEIPSVALIENSQDKSYDGAEEEIITKDQASTYSQAAGNTSAFNKLEEMKRVEKVEAAPVDDKEEKEKRERRKEKKKEKDSNKIGSYLAPREKKVRELQKKLEELKVAKKSQSVEKEKSSNMQKNNYDTIEQIEDASTVSKDDISFMIRRGLGNYQNTLLIIDKADKRFAITMQEKDFSSFQKWLEVKFGKSFEIKDKSSKKQKVSFKLIID